MTQKSGSSKLLKCTVCRVEREERWMGARYSMEVEVSIVEWGDEEREKSKKSRRDKSVISETIKRC